MRYNRILLLQAHDLALLFLMLLLLALAASVAPAQEKVVADSATSISNFGKVDEHYFRGSQPAELEYRQLRQMGIRTIIDLRRDRKTEAVLWANQAGLQYFNIPLKASEAATAEQTQQFLSLVNDPANWPVYVHCKGGRHRTGALTAVYRITHDGWTAEQAYDEMKRYDFNNGFLGGPSAQKKFVFKFYQRYENGQ
jgi:protein tyrosine/serine phosphatase